MDLSNRDIAFLAWLAVLVVFMLWKPDIRRSVLAVFASMRGKLTALFVVYTLYVVAVVLVGWHLGIWNLGLIKDTVAWFALPGLVLLFGFNEAYAGSGYYGRTIVRVIGMTALIEFYVNLAAFPLLVELVLLPLLVLLTAMSAVSAMKPETMIVKRLADGILLVLGAAILIGTANHLVSEWAAIDKTELALTLALPIWLTVLTLPFIYAFSLFANYEDHFVRIGFFSKDNPRARRRAKLALLASYHLRNRELHRFAGIGPQELARATSWAEARRILAFHRAEARLEEAKKDLTAKRLIRYAGVDGTDWQGRPLDQREFEETKEALNHLHTFHQAQHKSGRYRDDLMTIVGGLLSKTFPESEIVIKIGLKGRSWFAWRRTVGGWHFGIGATDPPPDLWTYEGEEPPSGFPKKADGWRHGDFEDEGED